MPVILSEYFFSEIFFVFSKVCLNTVRIVMLGPKPKDFKHQVVQKEGLKI